MNKPNEQHGLEWTAFRYIAGEMSTGEYAAFEEHLAVDQAAREAVGNAVRLTQAIAGTAPASASPSGSPRPAVKARAARHARWTNTAVELLAASVVCAFFVALLTWPAANSDRSRTATIVPGTSVGESGADAAELRGLLGIWSASTRALDPGDDMADDATALADADFVSLDIGNEPELLIPDWMLAAVSLEEESGREVIPQPAEEN